MIKIAITGNIGTGKTTVSQIVKILGYQVFESDEAVKKILKTKDVVNKIRKSFKTLKYKLVDKNGDIDKYELGNFVFSRKERLKDLENIIHPEIWKMKKGFIEKNHKSKIIFFDIPLLFEKKLQKEFDYVFYTLVSKEIQKQRVLKRKNMTENKFKQIICNQIDYDSLDKKAISLVLNTEMNKEEIRKKIKNFLIDL